MRRGKLSILFLNLLLLDTSMVTWKVQFFLLTQKRSKQTKKKIDLFIRHTEIPALGNIPISEFEGGTSPVSQVTAQTTTLTAFEMLDNLVFRIFFFLCVCYVLFFV